jgi:2-keto-4-pentenoate hydratase/2-oxohepta-3-ene-1,7-dioic acid hydratase in catechol pathway
VKLVRFGAPGAERPGLVDCTGAVRDLSGVIPDIGPAELSSESLRALALLDPEQLPAAGHDIRYGVPVAGVGKIIGIGYNYADHAVETKTALPTEPLFFMKAVSCLAGANDDVLLPRGSQHSDWEVELALIIGTKASYVRQEDALDHIAGYCLFNDVSERSFQFDRGGTWDKGKGCDTFGPAGPWLLTRDEIRDPQNVNLWLEINGTRRQSANTGQMIFGVARLVSYISQFMSLLPGDMVTTGTPAGIGYRLDPPLFLKPGDVMTLGADGLGTQNQRVRQG